MDFFDFDFDVGDLEDGLPMPEPPPEGFRIGNYKSAARLNRERFCPHGHGYQPGPGHDWRMIFLIVVFCMIMIRLWNQSNRIQLIMRLLVSQEITKPTTS